MVNLKTLDQPGIPLVNFTQAQIANHTIRFVHDGSDQLQVITLPFAVRYRLG